MDRDTLKALYSTAEQGMDALRDGDIEPAFAALESLHSTLEGEVLRIDDDPTGEQFRMTQRDQENTGLDPDDPASDAFVNSMVMDGEPSPYDQPDPQEAGEEDDE